MRLEVSDSGLTSVDIANLRAFPVASVQVAVKTMRLNSAVATVGATAPLLVNVPETSKNRW